MKPPRDGRPASSPRWKRPAILGVLLLLVLLCARPAYRIYQGKKADHLATAAERFLKANQSAEAIAQATLALQLVPDHAPALRVMAQALTQQTNANALQFWADLVQTGKATDAERRTYVEQSLHVGASESAGRELQNLLHEAPEHPANLWLASQWFAQIKNRSQALEYAAYAALRDPTNRQYKLFLSRLQFDAPESIQRESARANVWKRARENDALSLDALTFLAQRPELSATEKQEVITRLEQHPAHTFTHELLALTLKITVAPNQRGEILKTAVAHYRSAPPETRLRFAAWLAQNGETERILTALPLDEALQRKDFFMTYLDALATLKRWTKLQAALDSKTLPIEPVFTEAFRARCSTELKNPTPAAQHWTNALAAAAHDREQLLWLARYAEGSAEFDTARKALRVLIQTVENPLPAYRELEGVVLRHGSTQELRDVLAEMSSRWPNDPTFQNDTAYLNLLLGKDVEAAGRIAQKLVSDHPDDLPFRTTLALALFRQRDFKGALQAYGVKKFPWLSALPNQRAVFAAVLNANGSVNEARQMMLNVPDQQLRPEELLLVRNVIQ